MFILFVVSLKMELTGDEDQEAHKSQYINLLSIGIYLKNNMTKKNLDHHLQILSTVSNVAECNSSKALLPKYSDLKNPPQKVFICPRKNCDQVLECENGFPKETQLCKHTFIRGIHSVCFILHLPLAKQLQFFAKRVLKAMKMKPKLEDNYIGDVETGQVYKTLSTNAVLNENTLTLQLNIDGATCFKMSKFGFWPFMALFNEAPYRLRRSNVLLLAIWYGNKKPPTTPFVGATVDELEKLQTKGFKIIRGETFYLKVLIFSTDTPARPVALCTTQFNGCFGCDICLHPGININEELCKHQINMHHLYPLLY